MDALERLRKSVDAESVSKLEQLQAKFAGKFGRGSLAPASQYVRPEVISTGVPEIDWAVLKIGGLPRGRVTEIAGEPSAGKSTLALNFCREAIKQGLSVVIAENEGTITHEYCSKIGMPEDSYLLLPGSGLSGPEYLERILGLIEAGTDVIILDSLGGIQSMEMIETSLTETNMKTKLAQADLLSSFSKKLQGGWESIFSSKEKGKSKPIFKITDTKSTLVTINHLHTKIGLNYVSKESSGGDKAKFLYSIRLFLERLSPEKVDGVSTPRAKVWCPKNKLAQPFGVAYFTVDGSGRFNSDPEKVMELVEHRGLATKKAGWITLDEGFTGVDKATGEVLVPSEALEKRQFQGSAAFLSFIQQYPALLSWLMRLDIE